MAKTELAKTGLAKTGLAKAGGRFVLARLDLVRQDMGIPILAPAAIDSNRPAAGSDLPGSRETGCIPAGDSPPATPVAAADTTTGAGGSARNPLPGASGQSPLRT